MLQPGVLGVGGDAGQADEGTLAGREVQHGQGRRAGRALASVLAASYLLCVPARRAERPAVSYGRPPGPITS